MFGLGIPELLMILGIALVVFGPGKLPEIGKALGKGVGDFRRAVSGEPAKEEAIKIVAQPVEKKT